MHIAVKIPRMVTGLRSLSLREVLRTNRSDTRPQPPDPDGLVAADPAEPTISRRGALALVGSGVLLIGALTAGQTLGGAARGAALLLPRGRAARATSRSTRPPSPRGSRPKPSARVGD